MGAKRTYTVTVIATQQTVQVYKQTATGNWINYENCSTVYRADELTGLPDNA